MLKYLLPLGLVVFSNTFYQICAKSVPSEINPLASLTVTYAIAAVLSLVLYYVLNKDANIIAEYTRLNWAPFVLGFIVVGLEAGALYGYKAGWPVSVFQVVHGTIVGILLIFVGYLLYKEQITWNKIVGILVCMAGLGLINLK